MKKIICLAAALLLLALALTALGELLLVALRVPSRRFAPSAAR